MTNRVINLRGRGARGESFADIARRTGAYGATSADTDSVVATKMVAQIATDSGLLAAANYYSSKAAGETATVAGEFFSYSDGSGNIVYAERTADGAGDGGGNSIIIAQPASQSDLASKVDYTSGGGIFVDGGVNSSMGLPRDDSAFATQAPATGTPGQRHNLWMSMQPHADDEFAIVSFMKDDTDTWRQCHTWFHALQDGDNTAATFRPYQAAHGESGRGDYTPFILYNDNSVEFCAGPTGNAPFNLGLTAQDWARNFQNTVLQGGLVVGNHAQSYADVANRLEVEGAAFVGAVDGSGNSTTGMQIAWHAGTSQTLLQSFSWGTSTFQYLTINAAETRFGQGHVVPDADNTRDLGKSGGAWRNVFSVNAVTVTSDARLKKVRDDGPTPEEIAWAKKIEFVPYQMIDALEEVSDPDNPKKFARIHWGVLAQQVIEAGKECGIDDPFRYSFLTADPRFETVEVEVEVESPVFIEETIDNWEIEMREGKAVRVYKPITRKVQKHVEHLVFDEKGNQLTRDVPDPRGPYKTLDPETKKPRQRPPIKEPLKWMQPVTEIVKEKHKMAVPVMLENGEQDMLLGIRYEALYGFIAACKQAEA